MVTWFQRGASGCARLFELLDAEPEIEEKEGADPHERLRGEIALRDVVVRHDGSPTAALDGVSFDVEAGETVAILGRVGSGKSTLVNLLARLYPVPTGTLFVGGVDITEIPVAQLRRSIGYVPPEAFLFSRSLRQNILFGTPAASDEPAERALDVPAHLEKAHPLANLAVLGQVAAGLPHQPDRWAIDSFSAAAPQQSLGRIEIGD